MSFNLTLTKVSPLGEDDPTYGQKFWGTAEGSDKDVSFNLVGGQKVYAGSRISAEEKIIKLTKKNVEYYQLKKVKVLSGLVSESNSPFPMPGPLERPKGPTQLDRIEAKLNKLLGLEEEPMHPPEAPTGYDKFKQAGQQLQSDTFEDGSPVPNDEGGY